MIDMTMNKKKKEARGKNATKSMTTKLTNQAKRNAQ